jgi:hypothetical protein
MSLAGNPEEALLMRNIIYLVILIAIVVLILRGMGVI